MELFTAYVLFSLYSQPDAPIFSLFQHFLTSASECILSHTTPADLPSLCSVVAEVHTLIQSVLAVMTAEDAYATFTACLPQVEPSWREAQRPAIAKALQEWLGGVLGALRTMVDGVIAPLLYMLIGGAPLALTYKAINTMDSMLGYKNEKYLYFGRIPAKLDDAANYLPSRLAGLLWCAAAALTGNSAKGAWRIWRRDRRNHASPNSAQTESACAGALGVQLAGPAYYFGEYYPKPTIGDALRPIEPEDIRRANKMMYAESLLALLLGLAIRGVIL